MLRGDGLPVGSKLTALRADRFDHSERRRDREYRWLTELVFLHGRAASRKLTTARALEELLGYPVFHNHLVVDLLLPMFPFGSGPFVRLREQFWLAVFSESARSDTSITFTFRPEGSVLEGFLLRTRQIVEAAGGRVCFVRLKVDEAERERRITAPSRREFYKISDLDTLQRNRARADDAEQPPTDLEIDTTTSPPAQSARLIADHFGLQPRARTPLYPDAGSS